MIAYPNPLDAHFWGSNNGGRYSTYPYLPYSAIEKKNLDLSLTKWLLEIDVLKPLTATAPHAQYPTQDLGSDVESVPRPHSCTTLLAWEGLVRDGTVLCDATNWLVNKVHRDSLYDRQPSDNPTLRSTVVYQRGVVNQTRSPRTYAQCVSNVNSCLNVLRFVHTMSPRYLAGGGDGTSVWGDGVSGDRRCGVGDMVVRGCWDVVWGILEDIRR